MKFRQYVEMVSQLVPSTINKFIVGNSSADFDSVVGSLIYGYIKLLLFKEIFVPLIDCNPNDLRLRFEVVKVLERHHINWKALRFTNMVDIQKAERVLLYDHNVRDGIVPDEIIDHHSLKDKDCSKVLVGHCGSATTLLYYLLRPNELPEESEWAHKYQSFGIKRSSGVEYDPEVDELIRVGILLDSYNLSPNEKSRWDAIDETAINNIEKRATRQLISFKQLEETKFDETLNLGLSLHDHLVKDFKMFNYGGKKIAYSVILLSPEVFLEHYGAELREEINKGLAENQQLAYFLMFLFGKEGNYHRELILHSQEEAIYGFLNTILVQKLNMSVVSQKEGVIHYRDNTNKISRKILEKEISEGFDSFHKQEL